MNEPPGAWRVLGPALILWGLTAAAITVPGSWWVFVTVSLGVGVTGLVMGLLGRRLWLQRFIAFGAILAALLLVVGARIGVEEAARHAPPLADVEYTGEPVVTSVALSDFPALEIGPDTGAISGWSPATLQESKRATRVVLWFQDTTLQAPIVTTQKQWAPGTLLEITGTPVSLAPTSGAAYGISVERVVALEPAPVIMVAAAELRDQLRVAAEPVPGASLVPGFAVGDTALVSEQLDEYMRASSLTHLVAVSGANCALVTSAVIWALSWLGCGRKLRAVAAGLSLGSFVLIVGPDTSVQRAAIMGAVLLVSSYGGKRAAALPALGIAIALLLIIDPWQAWQPGFALSVAATGGIVLCAPALTESLRKLTGAPLWVALPVAVAAAAQIACGPLLLLLQDGIPASGLLANVLAGPAAPAGTALGLAALIAGSVLPGVAHALVVLASLPARWVEATAKVAAELPFARWDWVPGVPGALLLAAVEAALIIAWMLATGRLTGAGSQVIRPWIPAQLGARGLRASVAILLGCAVGVFMGPTLVAPVMQRAAVPTDWQIVACDVGQGDAILLRGSAAGRGEAVLVDTGDDEVQLRACLRMFGITRISLLVLTHDDRDHIGAVGAVLGIVDAALVSTATAEDGDSRPLLAQLESAGVPWREGAAGGFGGLSGGVSGGVSNSNGNSSDSGSAAGVSWSILAPPVGRTPATRNAASLVLHVDTGDLTALLLGDTGETEQAGLLAAELPHSDVVKVAHHGSRDQHPGIYDAVAAPIGLVSLGSDNGYGHPASDTLAALRRAGTIAARTDELGSIAVSPGKLPAVAAASGAAAPTLWAARAHSVSGDR